jgi:adenine-specific DNA-methyltransferase
MIQKHAEREHIAEVSGDILEAQVAKLRALFPEAVTEGKIDFDKLKAVLGGAAESGPGRFFFSWAGKDDALTLLQTPSRGTLMPVATESEDFEKTKNIFIEGENLQVLKLLFKSYFGRVKLIYIDPPYNTGKDFIYPDNFADPLKAYLQLTGQADAEGNLLTSNPETSGRYHSAWLSMMYPRLFLARQLLKDEGVICVSIDDFEVHHLRLVMNEIFGEENFIAQLVWEKGRKNDAKLFSVGHEYMVVYGRSKAALREQKIVWREPKPGAQEIWDHYLKLKVQHNDDYAAMEKALVEWYQQLPKGHPSKALARYRHIDEWGPWRDRDISWPGGGGPRYDVPFKGDTSRPCKVPEAGWRFATAAVMQKKIDLGLVEFRDDESQPPFLKAHLKPLYEELVDEDEDDQTDNGDTVEDDEEEEGDEEIGLQVMGSYIYKQSQVAVKYLKALMGGKLFNNPKDHEVLARLIRYMTGNDDIILDFFAGSGSTAEAVLQLNRSDPESNRRFMVVQLPEPTRRKKPNGKYKETAAFKAGYKNISALAKERIRRVIKRLKDATAEKLPFPDRKQPEDLGFKVFKLAEPNIKPWVQDVDRDPEVYANKLALFADPLVEGWKTENVLWEVALREGLGLNTRFEKKEPVEGTVLYELSDPDSGQQLTVCLDPKVRAELSKHYPLAADRLFICRDTALDDTAAANLALQCRLKTI